MKFKSNWQKTSIWAGTYGDDALACGEHADERKILRSEFLSIRGRVGMLTSTIMKDMPSYTVHSIEHLDALWETASLIAGVEHGLNPIEIFVLGCAILLHDAGMCVAAYPRGKTDIEATNEWRDAVASVMKLRGYRDQSEVAADELEVLISDTLRLLHAKKAGELPTQMWPSKNAAEGEYLIQDSDLRAYYGPIIGKVAASHWWDVTDLIKLPAQVNAGCGLPSEWILNPRRLACILRVADAANVDQVRAPHFLRTILNLTGESDLHWSFQSRLGKPHLDSDAMVYTSGTGFPVSEAKAWWLCFDALAAVNQELVRVDEFLEELGFQRLVAKKVKGAGSPVQLSRLIGTDGWEPLDTSIRVTDVPALVELLGGARLYGDNPSIAIRELIQNAVDAVRARRILADQCDLGKIVVAVREDEDGWWLDVTDSGVGMSRRVMTGALLDFGKSFWKGNAVRKEHPGLLAKGMNSIGRYGIGFFSVFMIGKRVSVTSWRYDAAASDMITLEFLDGVRGRPVLRAPSRREALKESGTRVSIQFEKPPYGKDGLLSGATWKGTPVKKSLATLIGRLCPGIDVNLAVVEDGKESDVVIANDWLSIAPERFLARVSGESGATAIAKAVTTIVDEFGTCYGRAAIAVSNSGEGVLAVDGFRVAKVYEIDGLIVGDETDTVTRTSAKPTVPGDVLSNWASDQARVLGTLGCAGRQGVIAAQRILSMGGDPGTLPIVSTGEGRYLNVSDIKALADTCTELMVVDRDDIEYEESVDDCHPREWDDLVLRDDVVFVGRGFHGEQLFSQAGLETKTRREVFLACLTAVWGQFEIGGESCTVGEAGGHDIVRHVDVCYRPGV